MSNNKPFSTPLGSVTQSIDNAGISAVADPLWKVSDIDPLRWNQNYPYQLMVLQYTNGGYFLYKNWVFTLPINPSETTIDMPFAINSSVTTTGYTEEHNGIPLRPITLSGTTGLLPLRGHAAAWADKHSMPGDAIIADSLNIGSTISQTVKSVSNFTVPPNVNDPLDDEQLTTTGYYQFQLLKQFLENYANIKKTKEGQNLRLAYAIWKDQSIYLVTPIHFRVQRTASKALEYGYQLSLKAWARIGIDELNGSVTNTYSTESTQAYKTAQLMYYRVAKAVQTIQDANDLLFALSVDATQSVCEVGRKVIGVYKSIIGSQWSISELPSNLIYLLCPALEKTLSDPKKKKKLQELYTGKLLFETNWDRTCAQLGIQPNTVHQTGPATTGMGDPGALYPKIKPALNFTSSILNNLPIQDLTINPSLQKKIKDEQDRVKSLSYTDYKEMRANLFDFIADYASTVGAGNSTYDSTYNRKTITAIKTEPSVDDYELMGALNELMIALDKLMILNDSPQTLVSPVEYIAGLARQSGIAFTVPTSKFAVPFPYDSTLEQLSLKYLGTPDRWHEIAALNGLRDPYVDEEGFDLSLLTNGRGNQIIVTYNTNLYIGQPIWISSNTVARTKRNIVGLEKLGLNGVITVDGDSNMDDYKTMAQAKLHTHLPDTVNSQQLIYIPSNDPPQENSYRSDRIPTTEDSEALLSVGGVDLMLKQNMDLAVTPNGDCMFSVGLNNIIQTLKIGLSTQIGTLLHHPEYGIPPLLGQSIADIDINELKKSISNFLSADKSFTGVNAVTITQEGPALSIGVSVGISGISDNIPIIVKV